MNTQITKVLRMHLHEYVQILQECDEIGQIGLHLAQVGEQTLP